MIDSCWFSNKSDRRNPDWFRQRRLFSSRYSKIELKKILTRILQCIGNWGTGRKFCRSYLSPFLWIGTKFDFFQLMGKDPLCKQFLKIIGRGLTIEESHIFNNLVDILSYPHILLILKECVIWRITWSLNKIDDTLALVTGVGTRGKVLLFQICVHWNAKKALKWKLPPLSGSSLEAVEPHPQKGAIKLFFFFFFSP